MIKAKIMEDDALKYKRFLDYKKKYEELEKNYNKVVNEQMDLKSNFDYVYNEYQKMIYSRSWKYTRIFRKLKGILNKYSFKNNKRNDYKCSILFFVHSWINVYDKSITNVGGTTLHVLDIINNIKDNYNCYVVTIINDRYMLVVFDEDKQKIYDLGLKLKVKNFDSYDLEFLKIINYLIEILQIDIIHIHHILGFPCDLALIDDSVKKIMTVHDYTLICPKSFLIDNNNILCDAMNPQKCSECVGKINIRLRNEAVRSLLKQTDLIIAPDESILDNIKLHYDLNNDIIIPHGIDITKFKAYNFNQENEKSVKINIAFVGLITEHKGGELIKQIVLNNNDDNIVYHLFGETTYSELRESKKNYIYHGYYNKNDLPKLTRENNIKLGLLLSNCPETYSYVLSELAYAMIPVLAFDIGALGNRIRKHKIGMVIPVSNDYLKINNAVNKILEPNRYNDILNNLGIFHTVTTDEMVSNLKKIYKKLYSKKLKNYRKISNKLDEIYLKYDI